MVRCYLSCHERVEKRGQNLKKMDYTNFSDEFFSATGLKETPPIVVAPALPKATAIVTPPRPVVTAPVVLPPKVATTPPPSPSATVPVKPIIKPQGDGGIISTPPVKVIGEKKDFIPIRDMTRPPIPTDTDSGGISPKFNLPTFPVFSTLDCKSLDSQIQAIQTTINTSRFSDENVRKAYENALLSAKSEYTKKGCAVPTKEDTPKEEKPPAPPSGGGGGGGGGSQPPAEETTEKEEATAEQSTAQQPTAEQPKKSNLLPILLIAGIGLYLLTRNN